MRKIRYGGDKIIKVITEMRCGILGWSEQDQGGQEAGIIHSGNKHSGFTIHAGFCLSLLLLLLLLLLKR